MVRGLIRVQVHWILLALAGLFLTGCVSTEELYAEYDAAHCEFVVQQESNGTLSLRELVSNTHFPWEPAVYFDFDVHVLDAESMRLLGSTINVLKRYPRLNLSLQGFADRVGSVAYNERLASRRAASVRAYLVENGIVAARIVEQPLGEGLAQFGEDGELSRSINRRVELMLLDESGRPLHPLFDFGES